jgi:hypothetical protein
MQTLDFATFSPDGRFVVGVTGNRLRRYSLVADGNTGFTTHHTWEQKLKHASNVVSASRVVAATNTAGEHIGIDAESGELLWEHRVAGFHARREGHRGLIMTFEGTEVFTFISQKGVLCCYDTATGKALVSNWSTGCRSARLFVDRAGALGACTTVPGDVPTRRVVSLDPVNRTTEELVDFGARYAQIIPSPWGEVAVANEFHAPAGTEDVPLVERGQQWRSHLHLIELATGVSKAMIDIPLNAIETFYMQWSPCGQWIGARRSAEVRNHLVLDAETLETKTEFEHPDARRIPAFHPDGVHVVLPRGKKSVLAHL